MSAEPTPATSNNPYAPPANPTTSQATSTGTSHGYDVTSTSVQMTTLALSIEALLTIAIAVSVVAMFLWSNPWFDRQVVQWTRFIALVRTLVELLGFVPFAMFVVTANRNARAFIATHDGPPDADEHKNQVLRYTPGSMVWWFFVPIANLVTPRKAVRAVWISSEPNLTTLASMERRNHIIDHWWASTIVHKLASYIHESTTRADPMTYNVGLVIISALQVAACYFCWRMIWNLHRVQQQRAAELLGEASPSIR